MKNSSSSPSAVVIHQDSDGLGQRFQLESANDIDLLLQRARDRLSVIDATQEKNELKAEKPISPFDSGKWTRAVEADVKAVGNEIARYGESLIEAIRDAHAERPDKSVQPPTFPLSTTHKETTEQGERLSKLRADIERETESFVNDWVEVEGKLKVALEANVAAQDPNQTMVLDHVHATLELLRRTKNEMIEYAKRDSERRDTIQRSFSTRRDSWRKVRMSSIFQRATQEMRLVKDDAIGRIIPALKKEQSDLTSLNQSTDAIKRLVPLISKDADLAIKSAEFDSKEQTRAALEDQVRFSYSNSLDDLSAGVRRLISLFEGPNMSKSRANESQILMMKAWKEKIEKEKVDLTQNKLPGVNASRSFRLALDDSIVEIERLTVSAVTEIAREGRSQMDDLSKEIAIINSSQADDAAAFEAKMSAASKQEVAHQKEVNDLARPGTASLLKDATEATMIRLPFILWYAVHREGELWDEIILSQ